MKKFLVVTAVLMFASAVYGEQYRYNAGLVDDIDIVIVNGTLNISSAKTNEVSIDIDPAKTDAARRHILIDNDRDLKIYLDGFGITENTVVNITVPDKKNDIEIKSANAAVNVSDVKGSLTIDTANGAVDVKNFVGYFDVGTVDAQVKADGVFKDLDIESSNADVFVTMSAVPSFYDYSVEGAGRVTLKLPAKFSKSKLKIEKDGFYGTLEIK